MKRLLLTRKNSAADLKFFADRGFVSQVLPLSRLVLRELTEENIQDLLHSHWIIFTSQTPVQMILSLLTKLSVTKKIACIGEKTAEAVRKQGFEPDFVASHASKSEMIEEWKVRFSEQVQIFYPMSDLALPLGTEQSEARIKNVICYENQPVAAALLTLEKLLLEKKVDSVYLTSPSAWQRFFAVYQKNPFPLEFIAIGKTTQAAIAKDGFSAILKEEL